MQKNITTKNAYNKPSFLRLAFKYLWHWFNSHNSKGFGIHSPSVFYLVTKVINNFAPYNCFRIIENERAKLCKNQQTINVEDYGTGSKILNDGKKKIAQIAKYSLKPKKQAQLIFRLANYFGSQQILELGTSLGITTSYLASVSTKTKVITLEGCPEISKIAQQTFNNLDLKNIKLITGEFSKTLNSALAELKKVDFVFFDGNHKQEATLNYFKTCLPHIHNNTVFIFDDIHYTNDMEEAWAAIKADNMVKVTIDMFHMGIVFFKKELTKQHFNIRF